MRRNGDGMRMWPPTAVLLATAMVTAMLGGLASPASAGQLDASPLPAGTYCQGPAPDQPAAGPQKVIMLDLENESTTDVQQSADAPFQNGVLSTQCGTFSTTSMHSTTHPSESNYFAQVAGLNAALNLGPDAAARFGLSNCPPDSTSSACAFGGGHFASSVPSIFSQVEGQLGPSGWKTYADDMTANCQKNDATVYATVAGVTYRKYAVRHNPAVYFDGIACGTQVVPSGNWRGGQGALHDDLMSGNLPAFSFIVPNDIDNGHDPVSVNGETVAGGVSQIGNIDNYLTDLMQMIQASPDYQSGNLTVIVTYDEGIGSGMPGDGGVGQNCADPQISPLATSCQVPTWIVGRYVPSYTYPDYMNQFGLLAAAQRILGLSPLLGHAADSSTPDIVAGTATNPNPFNLLPSQAAAPPAAPTIGTAVAGDSSATVSFTRPAASWPPVTGYTVTASPGGATAAGTASPVTVTGLTNGTAYTFTVTATNAAGTSAASAVSNAVTPAVPGPPAAPELLPDPGFEVGNGGWVPFAVGNLTRVSAPVRSGGSALQVAATSASVNLVGLTQNSVVPSSVAGTTYTASCWVRPTSAGLNVQIRILEYTQDYKSNIKFTAPVLANLPVGVWTQVKVSAVAVKSGERMIPQVYSTSQTTSTGNLVYDDCSMTAGTPVLAVPAVPVMGSAAGGDGSAVVSFSPGAGGGPATSFTVTAAPGGASASGSGSPVTVTGLSNGTAYTFTVTATNLAGTSSASAVSNVVTPAAAASVPGVPSGLSGVAGDGSVALSWVAPGSDGGSAVTDYVVRYRPVGTSTWTTYPDGVSVLVSATVGGLSAGGSYEFQVAAVNAVGTGSFSSTLTAAPLPPVLAVPAVPVMGSAAGGDGSAVVSFSPGAGGGPATSFTVTAAPGGASASGSGSPVTVTGLSNGTAYTFTVTATNLAGTSSASAVSNVVTPAAAASVPGVPSGLSGVAGDGSVALSWVAPGSDGGSAVTDYVVRYRPVGTSTWTTYPDGVSVLVSATVGGLSAGGSYEFQVAAVNAVGTGSFSSTLTAAPLPPVTPELLPDPGFEVGNGGWVPFAVGNLTRVSAPVRSGGSALQVAATSASVNLVGLTQNSVVPSSVAGTSYTASCWVRPTSAGLNVQIRILEYTQDYKSNIKFTAPVLANLPVGVWTQVKVSAVAVKSGERMIPQVYSTSQTTSTGNLVYDDCSVHTGP